MSFWTRIFRIFSLFVLGFFLTSIYRTVNAVLGPSIEGSLGVSPGVVGFATAAYFFTFALMQIPTGVLLDHYGPRRVQSALFSLAAIGALIFACAGNGLFLILGRLILGIGMAGGLMTGFVSNRLWFNKEEVPMLNSLTSSIGSLGTLVASVPAYYAMEAIGWRWIMVVLALFTFSFSLLILVFVPDPEKSSLNRLSWQEQLNGVKHIYSDAYFWRIAPTMILLMGMFMNFQSFWISPYLNIVNNVSISMVSYFLLTIGIGMILGMPIASLLTHILKPFKITINQVIGAGVFISLIFQILIGINLAAPSFVFWFFYAFFTVFVMTAYASITHHFPRELAGRATTALNALLFAGLFLLQFIFGLIVNIWPIFSPIGYFVAFWIFLALQAICVFWFIFGIGKMNEE